MKKLLILLSLSALVFGCDKHDDDYKSNIPDSADTSKPEDSDKEEKEYTIEDLNIIGGVGAKSDYRNVDRFIQGYMTVTNVDISGYRQDDTHRYLIKPSHNGPTVMGGAYKTDSCDEGFNEIADYYKDIYGPYDVVDYIFIEKPLTVNLNNIKYYVYVTDGDYDKDHPKGCLLNDIVECVYFSRDYKLPLVSKWTETQMSGHSKTLVEYNESEEVLICLINYFTPSLYVKYPTQAGIYSFRVVAKSGDEILCDKTIDNVELPARE